MKTLSDLNLTYEQAQKYVNSHVCLDCPLTGQYLGSSLHIENGSYYGVQEYVIRCIRNKDHSTFGRPLESLTKNEERIKITRRCTELENEGKPTNALMTSTMAGAVLTQDRAMEILKTIWPECKDEKELTLAAMVCHDEGLNPLLGEFLLIPYKKWDKAHKEIIGYTWSRQITIAGTRRIIQRRGDYSYLEDSPRIATAAEQTAHFGEVDKANIVFICKLRNVHSGATVTGWGTWPRDKDPEGTDKGNSKANMAGIRAERNALKKLPVNYLPDSAKQMVATVGDTQAVVLEDGRTVNVDNDGVIEGEATVIEPQEAKAPEATETQVSAVSNEIPQCPYHKVPFKQWKGRGGHAYWAHATGEKDPETGKAVWCYLSKVEKQVDEEKAAAEAAGASGTAGAVEEPKKAAEPQQAAQGVRIEGKKLTVENVILMANSKYQLFRKDIEAILRKAEMKNKDGTVITSLEEIENAELAWQLIKHDQEPPV